MLHLGMKSSTYSYDSPPPRLPGRGRRDADITTGARLGGAGAAGPAPLRSRSPLPPGVSPLPVRFEGANGRAVGGGWLDE